MVVRVVLSHSSCSVFLQKIFLNFCRGAVLENAKCPQIFLPTPANVWAPTFFKCERQTAENVRTQLYTLKPDTSCCGLGPHKVKLVHDELILIKVETCFLVCANSSEWTDQL